MEKSRLRGKGLYCCFIDFKKAFVMVPCEHLWRQMEESILSRLALGRVGSGIYLEITIERGGHRLALVIP